MAIAVSAATAKKIQEAGLKVNYVIDKSITASPSSSSSTTSTKTSSSSSSSSTSSSKPNVYYTTAAGWKPENDPNAIVIYTDKKGNVMGTSNPNIQVEKGINVDAKYYVSGKSGPTATGRELLAREIKEKVTIQTINAVEAQARIEPSLQKSDSIFTGNVMSYAGGTSQTSPIISNWEATKAATSQFGANIRDSFKTIFFPNYNKSWSEIWGGDRHFMKPFEYASPAKSVETVDNPFSLGSQKVTINPLDITQKSHATRQEIQDYSIPYSTQVTSSPEGITISYQKVYSDKEMSGRQFTTSEFNQAAKFVGTTALLVNPITSVPTRLALTTQYAVASADKNLPFSERMMYGGMGLLTMGSFTYGLNAAFRQAEWQVTKARIEGVLESSRKVNYIGERMYIKEMTMKDVASKEAFYADTAKLKSDFTIVTKAKFVGDKVSYSSFGSTFTKVKVIDYGTGKPLTFAQRDIITGSGKELITFKGISKFAGKQVEIPAYTYSISGNKITADIIPKIKPEAYNIGGRGAVVGDKLFSQSGKLQSFYFKEVAIPKGTSGEILGSTRFGMKISNPSSAILTIKPLKAEQIGANFGFAGGKIEPVMQFSRMSKIPAIAPQSSLILSSPSRVSDYIVGTAGATTFLKSPTISLSMQKFALTPQKDLKLAGIPSTATTLANIVIPNQKVVVTPSVTTITTPSFKQTTTPISFPSMPSLITPPSHKIMPSIPPIIPPFAFNFPKFDLSTGTSARRIGAAARRKYTPDYASLLSGRKGKATSGITSIIKGRPIPKNFTWEFGKKKKKKGGFRLW